MASLADKQAEQKKWAMKYFDYADIPIKEWISAVLDEDANHLFDDYEDDDNDTDLLNIKDENDRTFSFYLTAFPENDKKTFALTPDEIKDSPKLSRAMKLMFDSVYTVFPPVVKTMSNMNHKMEDVFPVFDDKYHAFKLTKLNGLAHKRMALMKNMDQIIYQFGQLKEKTQALDNMIKQAEEKKDDEVLMDLKQKKEQSDELEQKLQTMAQDTESQINEITKEKMELSQQECDGMNKLLEDAPMLYLCCEMDKDNISTEVKLRGMPEFGVPFQDPDEESYVDKYKKEHGID